LQPIFSSPTPLPADNLPDRIHYACGRNILPGWLNVDGFDKSFPNGAADAALPRLASRIVQMDLAEKHPFPSGVFRFGYSEDFLEHLTQAQSLLFLTECFRTFAEDGILRLSFPGLRGVLRRHFRGTDHASAAVGVHEAFTAWNHEHFYSEESLRLVAEHIGFSKVRFCQMYVSEHPELRNLETRPSQRDLNIIVELTK
jgi:predicted SAM-dependent methyltransferase